MKSASKAALWLLPATSLVLVASLTMATSAPKSDGKSSNEKKLKFPEQDKVNTYLTSVRSYMLVPPRDGRFGASRVPTLHGSFGKSIPGYQDIVSLAEKDTYVWSYVVGKLPKEFLEQRQKRKAEFIEANPYRKVPKFYDETSRLTNVHYAGPETKFTEVGDYLPYKLISETITQSEQLCRDKNYDDFVDSVKLAGQNGFVMAKAVRASDKSCYKCHADIKEGQPIGYVIALLVKKSQEDN